MESVNTLNDDTVKGIQDLIEINIDSSKGFKDAADTVKNPRVATLFRECSTERDRFAGDLKNLVRINGEMPETKGTVKGAAHRLWLDLRGAVAGGSEHAVLAEAERGEDAIKHRYEATLKHTAGSAVNDILQRQYVQVKSRHDQIRDLRDSFA